MSRIDKIKKMRKHILVTYGILVFLGTVTLAFTIIGTQLPENIHITGTSILLGLISGMWIFHLLVTAFEVYNEDRVKIRVPTRINYTMITALVSISLIFSIYTSFEGFVSLILIGFVIFIGLMTIVFGILLNYFGYFIKEARIEDVSEEE